MQRTSITARRLPPLALAAAAGFMAFLAGGRAQADSPRATPPARADSPRAVSARGVDVRLQNFAIAPARLTIHRGDAVTWRWLDFAIDGNHSVTSKSHRGALRFRSAPVQIRGTHTVTFDRPGVYFYECTVHPGTMQGRIVVR